jgi:HTH-type transcriptional regulator, competence development regulator
MTYMATRGRPVTVQATGTYFGTWLRNLRESRGFTVEGLAEEAGVSRGAVSLWESGRRNPKPPSIRKLAAALHSKDSDPKGIDALARDGITQARKDAEGETGTVEDVERIPDEDELELIELYRGVPNANTKAAFKEILKSAQAVSTRWKPDGTLEMIDDQTGEVIEEED